jgi:hypothetical protein
MSRLLSEKHSRDKMFSAAAMDSAGSPSVFFASARNWRAPHSDDVAFSPLR